MHLVTRHRNRFLLLISLPAKHSLRLQAGRRSLGWPETWPRLSGKSLQNEGWQQRVAGYT